MAGWCRRNPSGPCGVPVGFVVLVSYRYLLWRRFSYWFDGWVIFGSTLVCSTATSARCSFRACRPLTSRGRSLRGSSASPSLKIDVAGVGDLEGSPCLPCQPRGNSPSREPAQPCSRR